MVNWDGSHKHIAIFGFACSSCQKVLNFGAVKRMRSFLLVILLASCVLYAEGVFLVFSTLYCVHCVLIAAYVRLSVSPIFSFSALCEYTRFLLVLTCSVPSVTVSFPFFFSAFFVPDVDRSLVSIKYSLYRDDSECFVFQQSFFVTNTDFLLFRSELWRWCLSIEINVCQ